MADNEWLKNLAGASGRGKQLAAADPEGLARLAAARVQGAIELLYLEAQECCLIFNDHSRGKRIVNHLALAAGPTGMRGFMLLMGSVQITLVAREGQLEATLGQVDSFIRQAKRLHRFSPHIDAFGTLLWSMDNTLLMSNELIIKRLFEDLVRAAP